MTSFKKERIDSATNKERRCVENDKTLGIAHRPVTGLLFVLEFAFGCRARINKTQMPKAASTFHQRAT
jgi:hypothetical protein